MGKTYAREVVVKQPAVRQVLICSLSDILAEEVEVKFVLKRVHCLALHYRKWKLIPFSYHVISEEEICAVKLNFLTS